MKGDPFSAFCHSRGVLAGADVMLKRFLPVATGALMSFAASASAQTLKLPDNLTGFSTSAGETYFAESDAREAYFPLASNFLTQKTQAYCGIASIVMVLNSLGVLAPTTPEYEPYHTFTQDNVFTAATEAVLPRETIGHQGMTLDQIGGILATVPVKAEVHHAADSSADEFRKLASAALGQPGHFVIINYLRKTIGQERGGHISPLAAYDSRADRFLLLDVARYKYPPVWVKTAEIFDAMNTQDSDNDNKTRGFVLVSAAASAQ
jgi:Phytochelatin synthase